MAGAGAPFYLPVLWPLAHITKTISAPRDEPPQQNTALPIMDLIGNLTAMVAAARNFGLACLCVFVIPSLHGLEYPAFGEARYLEWKWMWPILLRNIVATWLICGFWDWFLYFSPMKDKLHKYKMNHKYPSLSQFKHDAFYTTLTSCWAALIEIVLCYGWATGTFTWQRDLSETPIRNILLALLITHWRIPHFHLMHRAMHPWRTKTIPDVGAWLYRKVHSLHHKSYNPTAFSGTSMHPVEGTLYYTAALIPVFFNLHPVFAIAVITDCALGAWLGHDGFQWPGSGDYFHLLHHQYFDCNYGAMHVPLDWLFGTFIARKEDLRKVWGDRGAVKEEKSEETSEQSESVKDD